MCLFCQGGGFQAVDINDLPEPIRRILGALGGPQGTWISVAKLSPEDILKKKNHDLQARRLASEAKVLHDKLRVITAQLEANRSEFWDGIYKAYSLPSDLQYKIDEDAGQVLKHVPPPPAENA